LDRSGATGSTNGVAATTDTFQITGLIVLPGIELPSEARAPLVRMLDERECMRQYEQVIFSPNQGICAQAISSSHAIGTLVYWRVPKRVAPAVSIGPGQLIALTAGAFSAGGTGSAAIALMDGVRLDVTGASGLTAGNAAFIWQDGVNPKTVIVANARLS
jgi:hypothetical protein